MTDKIFQAEYERGHVSGNLSDNTHILSSNMSDAFVLGVWDAANNVPVRQVHKSRGYTWTLKNPNWGLIETVEVNGKKVFHRYWK